MGVSEAELVANVAAAPDDDAPRLVYADWLLDRGDPRGELIVAQCALERVEAADGPRAEARPLRARERGLIGAHRDAWFERLLEVTVADYELQRGFVEHANLMVPIEDAAELHAEAPLLRSINTPASLCVNVLAAAPVLALDALAVSGLDSLASIRDLLRALPLRRLELRRLRETPSARDIAALPLALEHLVIDGATDRPELFPLAELVAARPGLRSLVLRRVRVADLAPLAKLPLLASLELAAAMPETRLPRGLQVTHFAVSHADVGALPVLGALRNVRRLRVNHAQLGDRHVIELAESPLAEQLTRLDVADNALTRTGMRALVHGERLRGLVELRLTNIVGPPAFESTERTDIHAGSSLWERSPAP